jgi:hypothetical protein
VSSEHGYTASQFASSTTKVVLFSHTIENMYFTGFVYGWQESTKKIFLNYDFYLKRDEYENLLS